MIVVSAWLAGLSPDSAVLLLTAGVALIYYELNRPGSIVPGAAGLLMALLSVAAIGRHGVRPAAVALILSAMLLLALSLVRPTPMPVSLAATTALVLGLRWLPAHSCCQTVHTPVAVGCGVMLGAGTSVLARVAWRARANKTGRQDLEPQEGLDSRQTAQRFQTSRAGRRRGPI